MRVIRGLERTFRRPLCLALGVFDGVHLGHQRVIGTAVGKAAGSGLVPAVVTFEPHPMAVLDPPTAPLLITTMEEKLALLRGLGVQLTIIATFDEVFAKMPAEEFIRETLYRGLRARCVVVGENWRFGRGGEGTPQLLQHMFGELGFKVSVIPGLMVGNRKVSSTRIRDLLLQGDIRTANELLGRPYCMEGVVEKGEGIGRTLGFPTANLNIDKSKLLPADGVYASLAGRRKLGPALTYVGTRPTFTDSVKRRVEVHLLEPPKANLIGAKLRVEFIERLREDRRFSSAERLIQQIERDLERARATLAAAHSKDNV